jgi:hypothetical protein
VEDIIAGGEEEGGYLACRLKLLQQQHKIMSKRLDRMQNKIKAASQVVGMAVDEDMHNDITEISKSSEVADFVRIHSAHFSGSNSWRQHQRKKIIGVHIHLIQLTV